MCAGPVYADGEATDEDLLVPTISERTPMIKVSQLTKRYGGDVLAVDDLSFDVAEGTVTGFLGPNGAGKTTTLRMLLGLVTPTSGTATINGRPYGELDAPSHHVGAVLEATSFHPGRRGTRSPARAGRRRRPPGASGPSRSSSRSASAPPPIGE